MTQELYSKIFSKMFELSAIRNNRYDVCQRCGYTNSVEQILGGYTCNNCETYIAKEERDLYEAIVLSDCLEAIKNKSDDRINMFSLSIDFWNNKFQELNDQSDELGIKLLDLIN